MPASQTTPVVTMPRATPTPCSLVSWQITFSSTQSFLQLRDLAIDDIEFRNCGLPRKTDPSCSYTGLGHLPLAWEEE